MFSSLYLVRNLPCISSSFNLSKALVDSILEINDHVLVGLSVDNKYMLLKPGAEGHPVSHGAHKEGKLTGKAITGAKSLRIKLNELDIHGRFLTKYDEENKVFIADLANPI